MRIHEPTATHYERARRAATEIADMRGRGVSSVGPEVAQLVDDIDGLVGHFDAAGRMVWPAEIAQITGLDSRMPQAE